MQLYTKILIGMAVGTVVGLTLGPKSTFLEADVYPIADASKVKIVTELGTDNGATAVGLKFPAKAMLEFERTESRSETRVDKNGEKHELEVAVRGTFKFTKELSLKDKTGDLYEALGKPRLGEDIAAWLIIDQKPLDVSGFLASEEPVSGLGLYLAAIFGFIGDIFLRLIKMVIVPLVFASLLVGIAGLGDVRKLGRLGSKTLGLYMVTTACAVTIGLLVAHVVRPGDHIDEKERAALTSKYADSAGDEVDKAANAKSGWDNVLEIIPNNPVESFTNGNMLQIIFFTMIFGIALTMLKKERSQQIVDFFDTIQHAMIMIIHMVMAVAPIGVAALLAQVIGESGVSPLTVLTDLRADRAARPRDFG